MNMQAMMKQAQKLQKEMVSAKNEIDQKEFKGASSFVTVSVLGTKEIKSIKINKESLDKEDIELLEDIIMLAINDAFKNVDRETNEKMGKYTQGMPGLF